MFHKILIRKFLDNFFNFNNDIKFIIFGFLKLGFNITLAIFAIIYILSDLGMYIFLPHLGSQASP